MPSNYLSNLNTAFCHGLGRAVKAQNGWNYKSIKVIGQEIVRPWSSGLCNSSPFSGHTRKSHTNFTPESDCCKRNPILKHFGSSEFQRIYPVFEYPSNPSNKRPMATSGSPAVSTDLIVDNLITGCGNDLNFAKAMVIYYNDRSRYSCQKARVSLGTREPKGKIGNGYYIFGLTGRFFNSNPHVGPKPKHIHTSSSPCPTEGVVPAESLSVSVLEERLGNSAVSADQNLPGDRILNLLSGSCYLPHPDKEETGGEDAHFICVDEQAIGVADGVGGWADVGVNAGYYARELMSNSVAAIQNEQKGLIDPAKVLEKAHSVTKAKGSSTACIITLTDQGIHAFNLGDSGFIVVRDGCTLFQSPVQQHGFNFTYQLERGNGGDLPSSGQDFAIPVAPGDIIVAGTDGLFDNLYNNEITAVVAHGVRTGLDPQATAQKIAALARERALDSNRPTPFSTAAQEAGFRYFGGKLDDITVVVSYITGSTSTTTAL